MIAPLRAAGRRALLPFGVAAVLVSVTLAPFGAGGAAAAGPTFRLYTRTIPSTWAGLEPLMQPQDLVWGHAKAVPQPIHAFTFPTYSVLAATSDAELANYAAVNLDGEYDSAAVALSEAKQIRAFVDGYNGRHPSSPLRWVAFYQLKLIDPDPSIVSYPDVVMFGKSWWLGPQIVENAAKYVSLVRSYGRTPGVVLGNYHHDKATKQVVYYSAADVLSNFHAVLDPAPNGLGLTDVSYFFDKDNDQTLISALQALGR